LERAAAEIAPAERHLPVFVIFLSLELALRLKNVELVNFGSTLFASQSFFRLAWHLGPMGARSSRD